MSDIIKAAAIIEPSGKVWSLPRPNRHHNIIAAMHAAGVKQIGCVQGFLSSADLFINRKVARKMALMCGQCKEENLKTSHSLLSEDLW